LALELAHERKFQICYESELRRVKDLRVVARGIADGWRSSLKLLVSVVDAHEALEAVEGGAQIVDVKNPPEGALGANFPWVINEVKRSVSPVEVSATIGDLPNRPGTAALAALGATTAGADYVKAGLLGPRTCVEATLLMKAVCKAVKECNPTTRVIAAAFADYEDVGSLNPNDLPSVASASGTDGILVDIATKHDRRLFDYMEEEDLATLARKSHDLGFSVAFAGLLDIEDVARCYRLGADIFGVRKSVCEGRDRVRGSVLKERVRALSDAVSSVAVGSNILRTTPTIS